MALRPFILVLMVLLLLMPHSGTGLSAVGPSTDGASHAQLIAAKPVAKALSPGSDHQDGQACRVICTGTPLVDIVSVSAPWRAAHAVWFGAGAPLSQALAVPATPSRPPDVVPA